MGREDYDSLNRMHKTRSEVALFLLCADLLVAFLIRNSRDMRVAAATKESEEPSLSVIQ